MSNQATSISNDLMVGAGELYFSRDDDPHGMHHLGNCEEFNITTDVTTVDKNSSMNRRRELMASVVTAVSPTASITLNEYNPYNLALGLFGTEGVKKQSATTITNKSVQVISSPGIIELKDDDGVRYNNVTDVTISSTTITPATFEWKNVSADYSISTTTLANDTLTDNSTITVPASALFDGVTGIASYSFSGDKKTATETSGGGTITLSIADASSWVSPQDLTIEVTNGTNESGDLDGLVLSVTEGATPAQIFNGSAGNTTQTFTTNNDVVISVDVSGNKGFTVTSTQIKAVEEPESTDSAGGKIQLRLGSYSGNGESVYVKVVKGTDTDGDLNGLQLQVQEGAVATPQAFTGASGRQNQTFTLISGAQLVVSVTATDRFNTNNVLQMAQLTPAKSTYKQGVDYIVDEQSLRAGVIKIPHGSAIKENTTVLVSAKVPEETFVTVSGSSAGEISGKLLFVGDPNIGPAYVIEGWKVKITPSGDLTGLIGEDFGSFTLDITFLADYENHPEAPFYQATWTGRADGTNMNSGIYDPEY